MSNAVDFFISSNNETIEALEEVASLSTMYNQKDQIEKEIQNLKDENEVFSLFPVINEAVETLLKSENYESAATYSCIVTNYVKARTELILDMKSSFYFTSIARIAGLNAVGILVFPGKSNDVKVTE